MSVRVIETSDWSVLTAVVTGVERDEDSFLAQPVTMKKRTILTSCKNRPRALKRKDMHGTSLLFKYGFCCRPGQTLSFPLYPQSDCYICQQFPEEMPHTHTHTQSSVLPCAHMLLQAWKLTYTCELKGSKEIRAVGQGGVHSASSANLLFLHLSRSAGVHLRDIALHFPLWEGRRALYAMHIQVDPCSVSPVRPLRGLNESFVGF